MNPDLTGHWNGLGHGRVYLDAVGFTRVGSQHKMNPLQQRGYIVHYERQ
jgi:hypothetical protein